LEDERNVVFKYYLQYQGTARLWTELNICMRLPAHQNIVPFDRVVIEDGKVVGFTNLFIPSGTIEQDITCPFKLK
jgi:hypothetical protein